LDVVWKGLGCSGFRLPTEAEWEYACRAGSTAERYGELDEIAWYERNSHNETQPVAKLKPNAWGLYDMIGNVWEWVWDWKGAYAAAAARDPTGPAVGVDRVYRGGSWCNDAGYARAAIRRGRVPEFRHDVRGFRPARTLT
jgi:formylglycine-generating enzyme required for sulfatase activity